MHSTRRSRLLGVLAPALLAAVAVSGPARANEYVVQPGDTLWEIAMRHGCTVDGLRDRNDLRESEPLRVERRLDLSGCARATAAAETTAAAPGTKDGALANYVVRRGDSLAGIARRQAVSAAELRRLNGLEGNLIHPGQRLRVPGRSAPPVRFVEGQSVGRPTRGKLVDGAQLPRDPGYYRRHLDRIFAAQHVVDHLHRAIAATRALHPRAHRLAIGDLSRKEGGRLSGHKSHQSGRDVDLGLYFEHAPAGYPEEFVEAERGRLDEAATWDLVRELAATAAHPGGVDRIFLDYRVQGALYDAARAAGVGERQLEDIFQYPDGKYAKHGIVRHEPAHSDHLHVRFKCPEGDPICG